MFQGRSRSPISIVKRSPIRSNTSKASERRPKWGTGERSAGNDSDEYHSKSRNNSRSPRSRSGRYSASSRNVNRKGRSRSRSRSRFSSASSRDHLAKRTNHSPGRLHINKSVTGSPFGYLEDSPKNRKLVLEAKQGKLKASNSGTTVKYEDTKTWVGSDMKPVEVEDADPEELDGIAMMKMMGFSSFDSTNGKQVEGNLVGSVVQQVTRRKYRQYMNRKGLEAAITDQQSLAWFIKSNTK